jgi:protein-disulfide isomerase
MSKQSLAFVTALALAACSRPPAATNAARDNSAQPAPAAASGVGVVAEVNGGAILASELEQRAAARMSRLRQEEYEIRRQALDELIAERLVAAEAEKRHLTAEELLRQEVDAKAQELSPARVEAIYEQNKAQFGSAPKEVAFARIREVMAGRVKDQRRQAFEKELRDAAKVSVRLEAPRTVVAVPANAPVSGPSSAPVTIIEFTDYQCPYCHRAQSVMDSVLSRYSGKVRLVHLDFPLDGHSEAVPAARAARCAGEQGKFWEYHRSLMTVAGPLDPADLKSRASTLQLEPGAFSSCLASGRHDEAIHAELRQGEELGVNGTPAYFVNGRMLSGARPLESFAELIDAELAGR